MMQGRRTEARDRRTIIRLIDVTGVCRKYRHEFEEVLAEQRLVMTRAPGDQMDCEQD